MAISTEVTVYQKWVLKPIVYNCAELHRLFDNSVNISS